MLITKIKPAFTDNRGNIFNINTSKKMYHIGLLTSKKGTIRAKHYHKKALQYTMIYRGSAKIRMKYIKKRNSKLETRVLRPMQMVEIPPFWYHEVEMLEKTEIFFFSNVDPSNKSYEKDTIRIEDIINYEK